MRVAEGTGIGWTENPTGINEWLLVSTGGPTPERLKVRTASFANAQALCEVLPGTPVADLRPTLISYFLISGDIAK
jgi:NADH-quinone oxidoreductase subunit D